MTPTQPTAKICPTCQLRAPSDGVLCRRCLTNLEDVPAVAESELTVPRGTPRQAVERVRDALLARPRILGAVIILGAVVLTFYVQVIRPPGPLPLSPSGSSLSVSSDPDTWPVIHGDLAATRTTRAPALIDGDIAWTHQFHAPLAVPVVTGQSALYVALEDGSLITLALEDGRELWRLSVSGRLDSAPTIVGDLLLIALRGGGVTALVSATGETRWSTTIRAPVYASLVVADGVVIAASSTGLVGLDVVSGEVLWEQDTDGEFVTVTPVLSADRIMVATNDRMQIFDRRTGEKRYYFNLPDPRWLASSAGTVTALTRRVLYTFDADETTPWWEPVRGMWANFYVFGLAPEIPLPAFRWRAAIAEDAFGPVTLDDRVIVAWPGGAISAFDLITGEVIWTRDGNPIAGAPVLTSDGLLVVERGALAVLDVVTGTELKRRDFSDLELREGVPTAQGLVLVTAADEVVLVR